MKYGFKTRIAVLFYIPFRWTPPMLIHNIMLPQAINADLVKALPELHLKTIWNILKCRKYWKKKKSFQWNLSKLLVVLKAGDSVHRGSSVREAAVFWLFSINTTTLGYCMLELFLQIKTTTIQQQEDYHFLGMLFCHLKVTERDTDFNGRLSP